MKKNITFIKAHLLLLLLICLATFLRIFQIDRYAIMFPDAGHDLLAAHQYIQAGTVPLLGITSSRPWLHQGPISLWIEMTGMLLFGTTIYTQSMIFGLLAVLSVIATYEVVAIFVDKKTAYFAVTLLAVFPLAVAHSRMPYHTTPIPLATAIYLYFCCVLWNRNSLRNIFLALLSFAFLFQFELSNAPLFFLLPYIFWRKKYTIKPQIIFVGIGALIIGLLPQIIASLTGSSTQMIGFLSWIGKQISEVLSGTNGLPFTEKLMKTAQSFWLYGGRIFSVDHLSLKILGFVGLGAAMIYVAKLWKEKTAPPLLEISVLSVLLLAIGYCVAGPPSEAYFPPFFILFAIIIGFGVSRLPKKILSYATIGIGIFVVFTATEIIQNHYFVENNGSFQYEGVQEQRQIAHFLDTYSNGKPYQLASYEGIEETIPAFFDHIRWFALEDGLQSPGTQGSLFLLEGIGVSPPNGTLRLKVFHAKVVYKVPNVN